MNKITAVLILLAMTISLFTGCQTEQTPQEPSGESSYEPLSEEKIQEIRAAWEAAAEPPLGHRDYHYLIDFASPDNYYGTHGDCIALYYLRTSELLGPEPHSFEVAGHIFYNRDNSRLYIYRNGEFKSIVHAYEDGWLTEAQVASIAAHHNTTYNYDPYH